MTDEVITPTPTPDAPLSTALETDSTPKTSGGGKVVDPAVPNPELVPPKAESVRDSLKAEMDKAKEPEVKPEAKVEAKAEKPAVEADATKNPDNKVEKSAEPVKADASEPVKDQQAERKSEIRERPEPPARFLPKAKELWRNTPNEVQSEVSRLVKEHETEVSQYRESHQFREELKEYEELGKKHNVTVKQALDNYVGIERKFAEQPGEGFRQLFQNLNMQPQQAISHILKAFNVSPQALAAHISQNPNAYIAQHSPQLQQQNSAPVPDPNVERLEKQLMDMQTQMAQQQYIEPFVKDHPRYFDLEEDIVFFLKSGKIPSNLSPAEKLAAAYDMAERINPSSNVTSISPKQASPDSRVDEDFNGTKSIKSSPGNVLETKEPDKKMSMRELLEDELKRLKKA